MIEASREIAEAVAAANGEPIAVEVPGNDHPFLLVDSQRFVEALKVMAHQKNVDAIRVGIEQMEAGLGRPLEEAMDDIRARLVEKYGHA